MKKAEEYVASSIGNLAIESWWIEEYKTNEIVSEKEADFILMTHFEEPVIPDTVKPLGDTVWDIK